MKKNRLKLSELKVSSFVADTAKLKAGLARDRFDNSPLCMETEGCKEY
ncbi:hypothetical protein AB9P05_12005 [Roseivirga sp. BDSF3-8]